MSDSSSSYSLPPPLALNTSSPTTILQSSSSSVFPSSGQFHNAATASSVHHQQQPPLHLHPHQYSHFSPSLMTSSGASPPFQPSPPLAAQQLWLPPQQQQYLPSSSSFSNNSNTHNHNNHSPPHLSIPSPAMPLPGGGGVQYMPNHYISIGSPLGAGVGSSANSSPPPTPTPSMAPPLYGATSSNSLVGQTTFGQLTVNPHGASPRLLPATPINNTSMRSLGSVPSPTAATAAAHTTTTPTSSMFHQSLGYSGGVTHGHFTPHHMLIGGRSPLARSTTTGGLTNSSVTVSSMPPSVMPSPSTPPMSLPASASSTPHVFFGMGGPLTGSIHLQQHGGPQGGSSAGRYNGLSDSSASRHFSHHHNTNTNNFSLTGGGSIPYGSAYSSTNNDSDVNSGSRGNGGPPRKGPDSPNLGPAAPPIGNSASLSGGAITTYASIGSFSQLSATPQGTSFSAHGGGGGTSGYSSGNSNRSRCSSRGPTTRLLSPGNVATVILGGNSQQQQQGLATVVTGTTQEVLQVLSSPNSAPLVVCGDVQSDPIVAPPVTASKTQLRKRGDLKLKRERAAVTAQQQFQQGQQLPSAASTTAPSYAIHFPGLENPSGNNGHHNFVTRGEELLASPPPAAVIALPQYQQHYIHHPHHSVVVGGRGADGAGGVESNSDATLYSSNPFVNISMTTTTASESSAGATILSSPAAALPASIHHNTTLGAAPQHSIPKASSSFDVGHAPTPALTIPSRGRGAEDSTVSLATGAASNRRAPLEALTDHRIKQRSKQIRYGKVTDGYRNYRMFVPIPLRQVGNPDHPETPRDEAHISKRHWDVRMREWRRALHAWDKIHSDTAAQQLERAGLFTADTLLEQDTPGFNLEEYLAATKLELENLQQEVAWHMAERERRRDAGLASEESGDDGEETTTASESTAKRKQRRRHNTADSDPLSSPPVAPQPPPTSAESTLTTAAAAPAIQQEEEEQVVEYGQDLIHEYRTTTPHGLKSSTAGESGVPIAPSPVSRRVGKVVPNKSPDRPIVGHMDPHAIAKMPEIIAVLSPQSNGALAIPGGGGGGASRHGIHPIQSPLKTHSGHSYRSLRSCHPDTPPRAGGALGAMQLGASLSSAHGNGSLSNSPVIGAMSIFQPYVEYDYFSLTQQQQHHQCRTVVTILHIDSNAQGSASSRNNSNNPPPSVGATATTSATGGGSSTKVNHRGSVGSNMSPLMQSGEGGGRAGSTGRQISPPTASLLSPTASPAITKPNTLQHASPFSGLLPAMSIPSLASPSSQSSGGGGGTAAGSFEKQRDRYTLDICHHPGDVLKALRQGLGLNPSRLTYAKQHHHTQGWDSPLLSPQSLYNVEERQLDTIEAVADWLKQAHPTSSPSGSQSTFTSSEDDMQMLRQVSDDRVSGGSNEVLPTTGGNGAAFQRSPTTVAVPPRQYPLRHLYILNRGTVRPQSCDEFAANASLSTPLQTHQGVPTTPQTPGKTTPSTGRASASTCGSPPIVNPLVGVTRPTPLTTAVTTSTSNNTAAPLSSTSTFQQLGIVHRVREGSMVNNPNGSMTANTSLFIAEQRSFFAQTTTAEEDLPLRPTTRQPGSSERTSPSSTGGGAAVVPTGNGFGDDILFKDGQVAQDLLQVVVGAPSSSPPRVPSSNASASSSQQSHSLHVAKAAPHPRHIVFDTGNYRSLSADQSPIQRNNAAKMDDIDPLESSVGRHFRQQHNSSVPNESRNSEGMNLDPTPTELVHQAGSPSPNLSSASATGQPLLSPAERAASFRPRGDEDHASLTNTAVFVDSQLKD